MEVVKIGKAAPNIEMIEWLTSLLREAKNGNIDSLAYGYTMHDGTIRTYTLAKDRLALIGLLDRLKHQVHLGLDDLERVSVLPADNGGDDEI